MNAGSHPAALGVLENALLAPAPARPSAIHAAPAIGPARRNLAEVEFEAKAREEERRAAVWVGESVHELLLGGTCQRAVGAGGRRRSARVGQAPNGGYGRGELERKRVTCVLVPGKRSSERPSSLSRVERERRRWSERKKELGQSGVTSPDLSWLEPQTSVSPQPSLPPPTLARQNAGVQGETGWTHTRRHRVPRARGRHHHPPLNCPPRKLWPRRRESLHQTLILLPAEMQAARAGTGGTRLAVGQARGPARPWEQASEAWDTHATSGADISSGGPSHQSCMDHCSHHAEPPSPFGSPST